MLDSLITLAIAEAPSESGITVLLNNFGVDLKVIIAQSINFIVVALVLWKFAFKPVIATLDERQQKIADGLRFAEESKQQLESAERERAEIIREANGDAQKILAEAREKAKAHEEKQRAITAQSIEDMRKRAEESNALERQRMLSEARQEIAHLVVATSAKVLKSELNEADKKRLNEAASKEIASLN